MKTQNLNRTILLAVVRLVALALLIALPGTTTLAPTAHAADPTPTAAGQPNPVDVLPTITPVAIPPGGQLKVMATTATVAYVVGQVGGDAISLTALMERGQDSHAYQPRPRDVAAMVEADLLFINGAGLEEFMHKIMANVEGETVIVPVSAGVALLPGHLHEGEHEHEGEAKHEHEGEAKHEHEGEAKHEHEGEAKHEHEGEAKHEHEGEAKHEHEGEAMHEHEWDPHTWTSPANVLVWVDNIERALSAADPANAAVYRANAAAYRQKLTALDEWAQAQVAQVPPEKRKIVTNHEAWNYFAAHYGFEQIGAVIPAVSTTVELSVKEFAALADALKQAGVQVIFVDYEVDPRLSQNMAETIGARVVRIWHELSPVGQGADTYEDWLRFNITQFVENLK